MERLPLEMMQKSSIEIREFLAEFNTPLSSEFEEYYDKALLLFSSVQTQLNQMANDKEMVERAHEIQAQKEREAKEEEERRLAQLAKEREELEAQKRALKQQQDAFESQQRAIREEEERKEAERVAEELQAKQESEKLERERQMQKDSELAYSYAVEDLEKVWSDDGMDNMSQIVDAIQAGQIRHIAWVE